jgi:hypothetical protein
MRKSLCLLVVTVAEEVVMEDMAAGMEDMAVGMEVEDMEAVGMAAVRMSMWITWYWNCLRAKMSQNISTCDVKNVIKNVLFCVGYLTTSVWKTTYSIER